MRPLHMLALALGAAWFTLPRDARAQLPIPSLAVVGGVSHYHLSGTSGSTAIGALRVDVPIVVAVAEGSLGVFRPTEAGAARTYVIPEAQLQWQLLPVLVRPYVGVGAGWVRGITGPSPHRNDVTTSASVGVRAGVPLTPLNVRAELRLRGIGGFSDHAAEWTIGGSW